MLKSEGNYEIREMREREQQGMDRFTLRVFRAFRS